MPFGFRQRQESITKAVYQAYNKDVIMLAAASNDGSLERMAFPARLNQVLCVCSADGYGTSSLFNPLPNMAEDNFTILGERVLSAMLGGDRIRKSGTSVATAVAAGIAALVLQLGFQRPTKLREADLRSYAGMRAIFVAMSQEQGTFTADGRYFIRPWILLDRDKDLEYVLMHISYILEKL
ncbi:peptidase S8/S53 domain-containing protein [Xylaria digitata]|nr:peptidase S8/S53 domain-containing protein [Xylaria digitata]